MLELLFMDILPLFYTMNFFYVLHEILKARRLQKCHKANWPTHTGNFLDTLVVTKVIVLLKAKMIFIRAEHEVFTTSYNLWSAN